MTGSHLTRTERGSLRLFDENGHLIGTIERPVEHDPLGPGHEKVYLARAEQEVAAPAAAA
jgi:hypothetical protein